jgi:hypothetical protein
MGTFRYWTRWAAAALALPLFANASASGSSRGLVPINIVAPSTDAQGHILQAVAPDGKAYPVFRVAEASPLVAHVRAVLADGFAQEVLKLDRDARNFLLSETGGSGELRLTSPMYLLLSNEEGGFARYGFWLEDQHRQRQWLPAAYVDLVVDEERVETGNLEEIFPHELGHLILKALLGDITSGPSRKMHQGMTVTDYPTAFDEGYAEHFQPLARDASNNPYLRELNRGATATDLSLLWISSLDGQWRTDGVKHNVFVHRKALPAAALELDPDRYQLYLDSETSVDFLSDELKNAQGMMASEGVIATLFYRIVNDEHLRNHYRNPAFYEPFLLAEVAGEDLRQAISPYENVNLKLFAALRKLAAEPFDPHRPLMLALAKAYASTFPDEAEWFYGILIKTTYGATVSQELAMNFEHAAAAGRRGEIQTYRQQSGTAFSQLRAILGEVAQGKLAIDANVGPELWLLNSDFKIAPAVWERERTLPLTINLNTATEAELMTLPGVDLAAARRIVTARRAHGFFTSMGGLREAGLSPGTLKSITAMSEEMKKQSLYKRD